MNDDEGTPPPIPPYRPEHAGRGPQDELAGPEPRREARGEDDQAVARSDRERALESLEAKAGFRGHLTVYLLIMMLLVGIWAVTSFGAFFWPIFPMMGWGVAVAIHGLSLTWERGITEEEIAAEMARLRRRRPGQGRLEE